MRQEKNGIEPMETEIQTALFEWIRIEQNKHPKMANIVAYPAQGGTGKEAIIRGQIRRREGAVKGFPDIMILFPSACGKYPAGFLEVKRVGESARKEQKEWIERLRDYGYFATVGSGFDECMAIIKRYAGV